MSNVTDTNGPDRRSLGPLMTLRSSSRDDQIRSLLLCLGIACQWATVWITWPLWQVRTVVPHLPVIDLPQVPFGWAMLLSAGVIAVIPSWGLAAHWIVLVAAAVSDQYRLQPQFFLIALLMSACVWPRVRMPTRWLLASTWTWAGLHKFISPDWTGHASHWLIDRSGIDADSYYLAFAVGIAISELLLGITACVRPRWAALLCVPMHIGIIGFLLWIDWNMSVIPWNLAMATIGAWVMWQAGEKQSRGWHQRLVAAACLIYPLGFYPGWVDHGFAGVLYSDWLPRGLITSHNGTQRIVGWGELAVPFPNERRLLRLYFERSAVPGDKLHISDPRRLLEDQYFVIDPQGRAQSIDIDTFLLPQARIPGQQGDQTPTVAGIGVEEKRSIFAFRQAGVRMVREAPGQPIYAVEFSSTNFDPALLVHLEGLPNLMQVQLSGTGVRDQDLRRLVKLRLLTGIGLNDTDITDAGIRSLGELPFLQYVEHEGTTITEEAINEVLK